MICLAGAGANLFEGFNGFDLFEAFEGARTFQTPRTDGCPLIFDWGDPLAPDARWRSSAPERLILQTAVVANFRTKLRKAN